MKRGWLGDLGGAFASATRVSFATRAGALAMLLATAQPGCTTPTLPLPPPAEPSITSSATAGKVHLHGTQGVTPNALVIAYNLNPNVPLEQRVTGTQADGQGTWDMDVTASPKDVLEISEETDNTRSPSIDVTVPSP